MVLIKDFDFSKAVDYHYGHFPPRSLDYEKLIFPLTEAADALARYDQMLKGLHNSEILLAPLRNQEAVVSSRMEGTISTLDEVLQYEADQEDGGTDGNYRSEAIEVFLYSRALRNVQSQVEQGQPISSYLIRTAHKMLMGFSGRGADKSPGEFKAEQNYLADKLKKKVLFIPVKPEFLPDGMQRLLTYISEEEAHAILKTGVAHLEFEALHPFNDGNGRIGRMLIPLILWDLGAISAPHFYISGSLEGRREEYIDLMREVSRTGDWTSWLVFFLEVVRTQAEEDLKRTERIRDLYEELKISFREILSSQWSTAALDFMFARPVFRNNIFTGRSGIPNQTAHRITKTLSANGYLRVVRRSAGRRAALYSFEPLLEIVRE